MVKISPDGTVSLHLTLPWPDLKTAYAQVLNQHIKTTEIKGFRKGKASATAVEQAVGKSHIYQDAFATSFSKAYTQIIRDNHLKPLMAPQVKATKAEEGQDWIIEATTAQAPQFDLGPYKQAIAGSKKLDKLFDALLKTINFPVSPLLVDQEKAQALSKLLDQVNRLGLTIDQYLTSISKTSQQLQQEYAQTATTNLRLEFILQAITADLKITPKPAEIDEFSAKSPQTPLRFIQAILAKRLTIDALLKL